MKSITEFASFTLNAAMKAHAALTAEGKTPEEISAGVGTAMKVEGDKLKYLVHAIEVATKNPDNLKRVFVVSLAEGENAPNNAVKLEEMHYVPEFYPEKMIKNMSKPDPKARGGKRDGDGSKKGSPWGLSPEEKAAKNAGRAANQAAAAAAGKK